MSTLNGSWAIVAEDGSVEDRFETVQEAGAVLSEYEPGSSIMWLPEPSASGEEA